SAPTDVAIEMAVQYGVTLCGFARGDRMNLYTHPERLL
ncbi:MAG: formate dehydrogenase accessory sulfurtransferase FdhD, partial [Clostridia bacterium]|nr:formate dehydrogenase accessory sulfurtransferase FdhD [Clostridia bacterium]